MKQKLILEIEAPDHLRGLPSMEEIKRAISRGFYEYFGNWVAQNIEINLSSAEDKPLNYNNLQRAIRRDVVVDYNEKQGYTVTEKPSEGTEGDWSSDLWEQRLSR